MILPLRSVTDCIYCDTFYQTYPEACEAPSYLFLLRNTALFRFSSKFIVGSDREYHLL